MIKYILNKPHFLFLALTLIILTCGFIKPNETFIFNIHDTYFVIKYSNLAIILSLFYGLLSIIYFALIKSSFSLVRWMTILHVVISIIGLILILFQLIRDIKSGDFESLIADMNFNNKIIWSIWISFFNIIGIQVLFIINGITAIVKGRG